MRVKAPTSWARLALGSRARGAARGLAHPSYPSEPPAWLPPPLAAPSLRTAGQAVLWGEAPHPPPWGVGQHPGVWTLPNRAPGAPHPRGPSPTHSIVWVLLEPSLPPPNCFQGPSCLPPSVWGSPSLLGLGGWFMLRSLAIKEMWKYCSSLPAEGHWRGRGTPPQCHRRDPQAHCHVVTGTPFPRCGRQWSQEASPRGDRERDRGSTM